jgi:transketolase N-terminal domain/subunit
MNSIELARRIRLHALRMVHAARASHIGSALSIADILAVLYAPEQGLRLRPADPQWSERDRFLLSKGHACVAVYAALAERGFFPLEELQTYGRDFARLMNHISHQVPGVEFSTGSLGHALPFGVGKLLAARLRGESWRCVVLLSDGELNEGSNWEALMFAAHHRLSQLTVVVDRQRPAEPHHHRRDPGSGRPGHQIRRLRLRGGRGRRPRPRRAARRLAGTAAGRRKPAARRHRPHRQGQGGVLHGKRSGLALPQPERRATGPGAAGDR